MHRVGRGAAPAGLSKIRTNYTPRWVAYYRGQQGTKPTDSRWLDFRSNLRQMFLGLCGYCENVDPAGEVDHFRPKSGFPERVYEWSNWVYACRFCNKSKGNKWPRRGYIDPCAESANARPENIFDFDIHTGEYLVKMALGPVQRQKAEHMIGDLKLNDIDQLTRRLHWIELVKGNVPNDVNPGEEIPDSLRWLVNRGTEFSIFCRAFFFQRGYSIPS